MIADGFGHALSGREASSPTSGGRRSDDERSRRTAATMIAYVDTSSRSVILYSKWCALSRESSGCADMTPSTVLPHWVSVRTTRSPYLATELSWPPGTTWVSTRSTRPC